MRFSPATRFHRVVAQKTADRFLRGFAAFLAPSKSTILPRASPVGFATAADKSARFYAPAVLSEMETLMARIKYLRSLQIMGVRELRGEAPVVVGEFYRLYSAPNVFDTLEWSVSNCKHFAGRLNHDEALSPKNRKRRTRKADSGELRKCVLLASARFCSFARPRNFLSL